MAGIEDKATFKWATVTGVAPIAIRIDGDTTPLALIPDSLIDPLSLSVGDRVRVELSLRRVVIHGKANGESTTSGEVRMTAAAAAPTGWLLCQGQSLLRSQYPSLFAAIGTTYGAADSTRFNLPDLRGRVVMGRDAAQAEFDVLGETGGAKTHQHTEGDLRAAVGASGGDIGSISYEAASLSPRGPTQVSTYTILGGSTLATRGFNHHTRVYGTTNPASSLPPYLTLNYIIKI